MPSDIIKTMVQKSGRSEREVSKLWDKAVEVAEEEFGVSSDKFDSKQWAYVTGILKNMLGIKESYLKSFLSYSGSADKFLETVVSGDFAALNKDLIAPSLVKDLDDLDSGLEDVNAKVDEVNATNELVKKYTTGRGVTSLNTPAQYKPTPVEDRDKFKNNSQNPYTRPEPKVAKVDPLEPAKPVVKEESDLLKKRREDFFQSLGKVQAEEIQTATNSITEDLAEPSELDKRLQATVDKKFKGWT